MIVQVSLICTVAGGRPLPCRSLSLLWRAGLGANAADKLMPLRMGGGKVASSAVRGPFASFRLGGHWRHAAGSQLAWRKGSHVRSVITAPEVKGAEQQLLLQRKQQQQQTATAKDTKEDAGREVTAAGGEIINDEGNVIRKFKPDTKRMLKIPQEEWPR